MRILIVGDPHGTPDAIDDCTALGELIFKTAKENPGCLVLFLGDQYHTHNVIRLEVLAFWRRFFEKLRSSGIKVWALTGNHDMPGDGNRDIHSMLAHEDQVGVINNPFAAPDPNFPGYENGIAFFPYMKAEELIATANCHPWNLCQTLICHGTFTYPDYETTGNGAKYENGIYAHDGINPNLLPQKYIISGHIHTPQEFGKVWYPGAPRWRILTDANVERGIWLVDFVRGEPVSKKRIDTGLVCRQIKHVVDSPSSPVSTPIDSRHDWRIDIKGPVKWVKEREKLLSEQGARVRSYPDMESTVLVRESEGIAVAHTKYVESYKPKFGTPPEVLRKMVKERLHV